MIKSKRSVSILLLDPDHLKMQWNAEIVFRKHYSTTPNHLIGYISLGDAYYTRARVFHIAIFASLKFLLV
jgi:hypothetical protein